MHAEPNADPRQRVLARVVQLAAFVFENLEEGGGGNSVAIGMLVPFPLDVKKVRAWVEQALKDDASPTLAAAARAVGRGLAETGRLAPELVPTEAEITAACAPLQRPFRHEARPEQHLLRAIERGVRYLWLVNRLGAAGDSRIFEIFVPDPLIPRGRTRVGAREHREHVVPCLWLYLHCERAMNAWPASPAVLPPAELAASLVQDVRRLLAIVDITRIQRDRLDLGDGKLKTDMPAGWSAAGGCAFARLHAVGIDFDMMHGAAALPCACT